MPTKVIFNYFPAGKFNVSNFNRWFKLCIHPLSVCLCVCARTHTHNSSDDAEWECRSTVLGTKNYHCSFPPILCGRMNSEHSLKVSTLLFQPYAACLIWTKKMFYWPLSNVVYLIFTSGLHPQVSCNQQLVTQYSRSRAQRKKVSIQGHSIELAPCKH